MMERRGNLLDVRNLKVVFHTYRGVIKALNGVELWMDKRERLGIVGETGCGKSVSAQAIMRLIEEPGKILEGEIWFEDRELLRLSEDEMTRVRGKDISMIFQEPKSSLNPVLKSGFQIKETLLNAKTVASSQADTEVTKMLEYVGMDAARVRNMYPHELSGGMAQRVMIAMALATQPKLLIADEPTSALDVTIQAQILELLSDITQKLGNAVMMITHDMGIVAEFCDRVVVMYAGNAVEVAATRDLFAGPLHPYTRGLLKAVPRVGRAGELKAIAGTVPDLVDPPEGCRFHPRCEHTFDLCKTQLPPLVNIGNNHFVSCHLCQHHTVHTEGEAANKTW
jgi:peptide/nickel transport system ATP-binding protein